MQMRSSGTSSPLSHGSHSSLHWPSPTARRRGTPEFGFKGEVNGVVAALEVRRWNE